MRILCLFPGLSTRNEGGVQLSGRLAWRAVADHAARRGEEAGLFVYGLADEEDTNRFPAHTTTTPSRLGAVWSTLTKRRPAPLLLFWHVDLLRLLPFLRTGPARVAVFLHGVEAWRPPGFWARRLLDRVDLFLTNTAFTWKRFVDFHPHLANRPHQIVALGCGEPTPWPVPPPSPTPAALLVGRAPRSENYKGHRELIAAWPEVSKRVPGAELWIAGTGDLIPDLKDQAVRLGVSERVRFLGFISEADKQRLMHECRCLTMPSLGEGFGLVYLEAMRVGRPCLVSDQDAGQEVVQPPLAGLAVNPAQPAAVIDAVVRLLTDGDEWRQWSAAAHRHYNDAYTTDHFGKRLLHALFEKDA